MPNYAYDDALYTGTDRYQKFKIHRNRRVLVGPNLISKYVWYLDSHASVFDYIDDDTGKLKNFYKKKPFPSLIALENYTFDHFNVAYSSNKRKRWRLINDANETLHDVQNPELHSRVSLLRMRVHCFQQDYFLPEKRSDFVEYDDIVLEFHGYNEDERVDISNVHFEEIYRKNRTWHYNSNWWEGRKQKRSVRKKKKVQHELLRVNYEKSRQDDHLPHEQRNTHVIVKEQIMYYAPGMINSGSRKFSTEEGRRKRRFHKRRRILKRKRRPHFLCRLKRKQLLAEGEDLKLPVEKEIFAADEEEHIETSSCEMMAFGTYIFESIIAVHEKKKRKSPKKQKLKWTPEYQRWYEGKPKDSDDEEKLEVAVVDEALSDYEALPQILVSSEDDSYARVEDLLSFACRVDGLQPAAFILDLSEVNDRPSISNLEYLQNFTGFVVLQRGLDESSILLIRIILNAHEREEEPEQSGSQHKTPKRNRAYVWGDCAGLSSEGCNPETAKAEALQRAYKRDKRKVPAISLNKVIRPKCCVCDSFDNDGFALECGHYGCRNCWAVHALIKMNSALVPVTCPEMDCDTVLTDEHMLTFLPVRMCLRYKILCCNKEFMKPEWVHCTNCSQIIFCLPTRSVIGIAVCECGEYVCRKCKDKAHIPLSCEEAQFYDALLNSSGRSAIDEIGMTVRLKKCYACGNFCEKLDGCNHMTCLCGKEFCYICGEEWISYETHDNCKKDVFFEVEMIDVPKGILNRIPMKVFAQCLNYRQYRQSKRIYLLRLKLVRVLGPENAEIERILGLYCAASQILELSTLKIAFLKRAARHARSISFDSMKAGRLRTECGTLLFHLTRLQTVAEMPNAHPKQIIKQKGNVERSLNHYLSQFSCT